VSPYAYIVRLSTNDDNMPIAINSIRDVAAAVRGRRQKLGLSQESVAHRARVSRQWLIEFEAGKPTAELQLVMRLLDALGLRLVLDVPNETPQNRPSTPPATVDLDTLLDKYQNS
jgi:y4mF family transcriptional regulator